MTRYGMAIDMDHCVGCQTCAVSCQLNNALPPGAARLHVDTLEWGRWPEGDRAYFPRACIHCADPLCVRVCPTGASRRRADGIVAVEPGKCIGCGVCVTACEYGARSISRSGGFHFGADGPAPYEAQGSPLTGVADKCDFCAARVDAGEPPACVRDCVAGVRAFGDLDDQASALNAFIVERGCDNVPNSALYYACGARELDLRELVSSSYTSAKEDRARQQPAQAAFNPTVVGGAAVAAVAVGAGLGVSAQRSRARRRRDEHGIDPS